MKNLTKHIQEALKIGKDFKYDGIAFTDNELRDDYKKVDQCIYKKEKQEYADKYNVSSVKIKDIQLAILDILKKNRQKKDKFDDDDVLDFIRLNIPEKNWPEYFDEEPIEFIQTLFDFFEFKYRVRHISSLKKLRRSLSSDEKLLDRRYNIIKSYLDKH